MRRGDYISLRAVRTVQSFTYGYITDLEGSPLWQQGPDLWILRNFWRDAARFRKNTVTLPADVRFLVVLHEELSYWLNDFPDRTRAERRFVTQFLVDLADEMTDRWGPPRGEWIARVRSGFGFEPAMITVNAGTPLFESTLLPELFEDTAFGTPFEHAVQILQQTDPHGYIETIFAEPYDLANESLLRAASEWGVLEAAFGTAWVHGLFARGRVTRKELDALLVEADARQ